MLRFGVVLLFIVFAFLGSTLAFKAWMSMEGKVVNKVSVALPVKPSLVAPTTEPSTAPPTIAVAVRSIVPVSLGIKILRVLAPVTAASTVMAPDKWLGGKVVPQFPVPPNATSVDWWQDGAKPGTSGLAVFLGHHVIGAKNASQAGVFDRLSELQLGDDLTLIGQDGDVLHFSVIAKATPSKTDSYALQDTLQNAPPLARVALVTCDGPVNAKLDSHQNNLVVFAAISS